MGLKEKLRREEEEQKGREEKTIMEKKKNEEIYLWGRIKREGSDKVGIFFKQENFIQLVKLKIDTVKLVHWYDGTW